MPNRSVICIGNFDGVHVGHRGIIEQAQQLAKRHGVPVRVLTFGPHPAAVLRPNNPPLALLDSTQKVTTLRHAGADEVVVIPTTPDLLALDPKRFIEQSVSQHAPVAVVEGSNFRFGKDRQGDIKTLQQLGEQFHFDVCVVPPVSVTLHDQWQAPVSSSLIRWLLSHGRVADAARCLGTGYTLTGPVVLGQGRGRTIGVPTLNLDPDTTKGRAIPANGVYAGFVQIDNNTDPRPAAISVGYQPTFGSQIRSIEAHILDFNADLYHHTVRVGFARWVRDQQRFPSPDHLREQIQRDIDQVRWHDRLHLPALDQAARCATGVG